MAPNLVDPIPLRRARRRVMRQMRPRRSHGAMAARLHTEDLPGLYPSWWHFWCAVAAYLLLLCVIVGALIVVLSLAGAAVSG